MPAPKWSLFIRKRPTWPPYIGQKYPQARQARTPEEILEDKTIDLVITSGIPSERAPLGIRVDAIRQRLHER